ncbi:rRNA-processing protein fcf2 [Artemisia annua]|uniref:rRNA-processing protein fcf2 n=1 Tax=Artemisia annua TaxID=35608 RepID=A0A2U1MLQ1_ARTAN|nr:rRNA-processing protein fcf2 [Artemisia annua]
MWEKCTHRHEYTYRVCEGVRTAQHFIYIENHYFLGSSCEKNWEQYAADKVTDMTAHLLKYPVEVDRKGQVKPLPGCPNFPDVNVAYSDPLVLLYLLRRTSPYNVNVAYSDLGSNDKSKSVPESSLVYKPNSELIDGLFVPPNDPKKVNKILKKQVKDTAGKSWFDMPAPTLTPELKKDLQLLKDLTMPQA